MSGMKIRKSGCHRSLIPARTLVSSLFWLFIFPFSEAPSRCAAVLFIPSLFREAEEGKGSFSVLCDGVSMAPAVWCWHARWSRSECSDVPTLDLLLLRLFEGSSGGA